MSERARPDPEQLLAQAGWLRRLARGLVQDAHAADDLVQDTWVAALENGPKEPRALAPWLAQVTRNLAQRRVRAEANRRLREERGARPEGVPAQSEVSEHVALQRELLELVLALDEPYRSTLLERYFEERSPGEIARRAGIPVRTVKTRLARGLAQLRERLERKHTHDRDAFALALVGFARGHAPLYSTLIGGMLVNWKLATASAVLLAALLGIYWWRAENSALATAALGPGSHELASDPAASTPVESATAAARNSTPPPIGPAASLPEDDPGALRGIVVDSRHVPIPGAEIEVLHASGTDALDLWSLDDARARIGLLHTDASGQFRLPAISGQSLDLAVRARGFAPAVYPGRYAGDDIVVVLGAPTTLEGHVKHKSDGSPCALARIRCSPVRRDLPGPADCSTETDAEGRFEFNELPPGGVSLTVLPVDAQAVDQLVVKLPEGGRVTHDILLETGIEVEGMILDDVTGDPIPGARVDDGLFRDGRQIATTGADGHFVFGGTGTSSIPPSVSLNARAEGYGVEKINLPWPTSKSLHVVIRLHSGVSARGSLVDSEGRPVIGARVRIVGLGETYDAIGTRSDSRGGFELQGLRRDLPWMLRIDADGCATCALALPAPPLRGTCVDFGELTLRDQVLLRGRLVDSEGHGIEGFPISLCNDHLDAGPFSNDRPGDTKHLMHPTRTDSRGRFAIGGLCAGTYTLTAERKGCGRSITRNVRVEADGASNELLLTLDLGASIEGVLVGPDGSPVADCVLDFYPVGEEHDRAGYLLTSADGSFKMNGLADGEYAVVAHPQYLSAANRLAGLAENRWEHVRTGTSSLRFALLASDPIEGIATLPDGAKGEQCMVLGFRSGTSMEDWPEFTAFTDAGGRFRMTVPKGTRVDMFAMRTWGRTADGYDGAEAMNIPSGTKNLELKLIHRP